PRVINTDKAPALAKAISELKAEGICPPTVEHRQVKYLNNILEGDHGRLKRILGPKGAFKNRTSAYRTLKGMEAMHSLRKGQGTMFDLTGTRLRPQRRFSLIADTART
ncbi:transposase, partial [Corynebacterium ammoniagenes]